MLYFRLLRPLLLLAYHLLYHQLAFTYDIVSALVSRGRWRDWTRAAIPHIAGARVLELPIGTGNLHLDLRAAEYKLIGVDLSPAMVNITRGKFRRAQKNAALARARAQALPFANASFDSIVMTFPAAFVHDARTFQEFFRVLDARGRVIWVDAAHLTTRGWLSRLVNSVYGAFGGRPAYETTMTRLLAQAGFAARVEIVADDVSAVSVAIGIKVSLTTSARRARIEKNEST